MNCDYEDIRCRIDDEPKWFDENSVPRYCEFHPSEVSCIYANEAALVDITCQNCQHEFKVAFSRSTMDTIIDGMKNDKPARSLAALIEAKEIQLRRSTEYPLLCVWPNDEF